MNQTWMTMTPRDAASVGQAADILDHILLARMLRRTGGGEGAALHHHVVLHVLDDEGAARRVDRETALLARALRRMRKSVAVPARALCAHERLDARSDLCSHARKASGWRT